MSSTHIATAEESSDSTVTEITPLNPTILTDLQPNLTSVTPESSAVTTDLESNGNESPVEPPLLSEPTADQTTLTEEEPPTISDELVENSEFIDDVLVSSALEIQNDDIDIPPPSLRGNEETLPEDSIDTPESESVAEVNTPLVIESNSDSLVTFDRERCVAVSDGNFYCQTDPRERERVRADGVYAYPDRDGDLEIYIQRTGELTQITHNQVEDASPVYDPVSNTIVWHRLIDGRYQIVSYDISTETETVLTVGATNNMEPTRQGQFTAWQTWLDNNWEIVLYDGTDMLRLTHSPEPDVSPQLRNGLLLWQRIIPNGDRFLEIYNIATKEKVSIRDEGDGIISNPRLMVVFDSESRNGDRVVKGYDILTGEIVSVGTSPTSAPVEIPNPNPTGEPTALLVPNNKSTLTGDLLDNEDDEDTSDDEAQGSNTPEESSLSEYNFDDETTLVLFDYGIATSTALETNDIASELTDSENYTIDMRADDQYEELTLEIPVYEASIPESDNQSLSSDD